jgi:hypothetical protein
MLKFKRLESQIILKSLGARKPKGPNRIAKIQENDTVLYTQILLSGICPLEPLFHKSISTDNVCLQQVEYSYY